MRRRRARLLYSSAQARALLARADRVVVSTPGVAASVQPRNVDLVLPTIPDVTQFRETPSAPRPQAPLRLGWVGSAENTRYLRPLAPLLARLADEGVARLTVVSTARWAEGSADFEPWSREREAALISAFDVGLMPLPDTPYTAAKSAVKVLEYMAGGAAVVASPVGVTAEVVSAAGAGILATAPEAWEAAIRTLATDAQRRAALGTAGRAFAEAYCDLRAQADALATLLSA